jgi:hypothetical protein
MIESVFTIVGIILGFILSEVATHIRNQRSDARQAASIRTMVRLETAANLEALRVFWKKLHETTFTEETDHVDVKKQRLALRFAQIPLPIFKDDALKSQLPQLPMAVQEGEVTKIFRVYDRLSNLYVIRSELVGHLAVQREEMNAATATKVTGAAITRTLNYFPATPFNDRAVELWDAIQQAVEEVLSLGNPLGKP